MSEGQTIREAFRYLQGYDVAGMPGHLRGEEIRERMETALAALEARLAEAERERDEWKAAAMRSRPGLLRAALPSESERSDKP